MKLLHGSKYGWAKAMGLLVLVSAFLQADGGRAQSPQPANLPKITYTKNTIFHLPVQMDDRTRANLREVCLYVKAGSSDWVRQETGLPTMTHFSYKVPRDGEYWFSLVSIDKAGKMIPADVSQEPPGLRVMVNTQAPVIDVQPWTSPEGDFCLRCTVQDANPNPQSLKAAYHDASGDHVLEPMPGNPNAFKIAGREVLEQPLHVTAADMSGNMASRDVNVREMVIAALQQNRNVSVGVNPPSVVPPPPAVSTLPGDPIRGEVQKPVFPINPDKITVSNSGPALNQNSNITVPPPPPNSAPPLPTLPTLPPAAPVTQASAVARESSIMKPVAPPVSPLPGPQGNTNGAAKQILNTTHATVDYRIDQVGPSGVGKVEVYLTGDGGLNWQRLQEDQDRRSPAEIDLPGEGLFGIRLVVTNGNGFGGTPPARGDAPTCWIEVDTTAPFVQLRPIDPAQNGVMELRWTASDKNLGAEPITLYYKTRHDGPWQIIARNVRNEGMYRWTFPRDQGSQFFVKVEVTDLAGNTAHAEMPNAIVLDITEPHASVVGVTGMTPRVTPPSGN